MDISPSVRKRVHLVWQRVGSFAIALGVVVLLVVAFVPRAHDRTLPSLLLALCLAVLSVAMTLHAHFLILAHREQRRTEGVLDTTEREFQSIFDSALDAILILDDQGICLESNPAALAVLGAKRRELVGRSFRNVHFGASEDSWLRFLSGQCGIGEMQLSRRDGRTIFIEYTVKPNYLPGRHVAVLRDISERKRAEMALRESEDRFQQMAANIQEVFWMLDLETKHVVYVNQAFEAITGRTRDTLFQNPISYQELFHPEDRVRVLTRLEEASHTGQFDEEFRINRTDHMTRWISARGFAVRDSAGAMLRLVGTARDITARKSAEEQMARNLALAESARAEADAFRAITLALTQNLRMDTVLDTLLESLLRLVPCESARVLLLETHTRLFLAREIERYESARRPLSCPSTWDALGNRFFEEVLSSGTSVLISDSGQQSDWRRFKGNSHFGSWLCVPLIASQNVLGLLSLGDTRVNVFSPEHLRLAKSLAIPAAVAIQNARLYERAEIYSAELEQRLGDLELTQNALRDAEQKRELSEERFSKVFRSSPIAFSITTVEEGRFIDVNEAFEARYGYTRKDLLGCTVSDLTVWHDPSERASMVSELRERGRVRNRITRLRKNTSEILDTFYSADLIEVDGRECVLAVSEDLPDGAVLRISPSEKLTTQVSTKR